MDLFLWCSKLQSTKVHKLALSKCASLVPARLEPLRKLRRQDSPGPPHRPYQQVLPYRDPFHGSRKKALEVTEQRVHSGLLLSLPGQCRRPGVHFPT